MSETRDVAGFPWAKPAGAEPARCPLPRHAAPFRPTAALTKLIRPPSRRRAGEGPGAAGAQVRAQVSGDLGAPSRHQRRTQRVPAPQHRSHLRPPGAAPLRRGAATIAAAAKPNPAARNLIFAVVFACLGLIGLAASKSDAPAGAKGAPAAPGAAKAAVTVTKAPTK